MTAYAFDSYAEASKFASQAARKHIKERGSKVLLTRSAGSFVVEVTLSPDRLLCKFCADIISDANTVASAGPKCCKACQPKKPVPVEPDQAQLDAAIASIRSELKSSVDAEAIAIAIESHLTEVTKNVSALENADDREFVLKLPKYLEALSRFLDGLSDKPYARSKEFATGLAYKFSEISELFGDFKFALRANKEARELAELAKTLPSEATAADEVAYRKEIRNLETAKGPCNCSGGRWEIKCWETRDQSRMFWGCSTFPKCFKTRRMTTQEFGLLSPWVP